MVWNAFALVRPRNQDKEAFRPFAVRLDARGSPPAKLLQIQALGRPESAARRVPMVAPTTRPTMATTSVRPSTNHIRIPKTTGPVLVRQANWRKIGGGSPPRRRSNQPRLSASRASGRREGSGEASVAVHVGGQMSIERTIVRSAEAFRTAEGNTGGIDRVRCRRAPRCQRTRTN